MAFYRKPQDPLPIEDRPATINSQDGALFSAVVVLLLVAIAIGVFYLYSRSGPSTAPATIPALSQPVPHS